ncbi:hypothetical protein SAMN05421774_11256 [Gemmobacter megaterium]|uniref:Uncharacterized protein n=1 Tax=Gemmobacter megaterium TaxID=1086013 RepID=A0A1N7QJR8_9RHOB|nr:hypothetical protein [Gemmobacter megaterium]GGE26588.1 hypothetical protein GCM10011345_35710 [Gemmobacter megaterium]SIT22747.1 hypothetical protein SAMN05421774_11256 [Gemmobacter megaterium]
MIRDIIDIPLPFLRALTVDWRPDWRGQPPATGTDGSDQVVYNAFPRWVGAPQLVLPPEMVGAWRALVLRGQGRVNAYRVRMVDPVVSPVWSGAGWREVWSAWQSGLYVEPRPQMPCAAPAAAGATSIVVDESALSRPITVGSFLSYQDWPFAVTGRSGSGAATTLQVELLRVAIPAGAQIDVIARGVFLASGDAMGLPAYGLDRVARPQLDLVEWITR